MGKEKVNKKQVTTHGYWIQTYIPVFNTSYGERPTQDEAYFSTYEEALSELEHSKFMQPENIYEIKTIRIKDDDSSAPIGDPKRNFDNSD